jgi:hypothetical protein
MGLQKTIQTNIGIDAIYWRVGNIDYLDPRLLSMSAYIYGYKEKASSDEGYNYIKKIKINITGSDYDEVVNNSEPVKDARDWVYNAITYWNSQLTSYEAEKLELEAMGELSEEQELRLSFLTVELENSTYNIKYFFKDAVNILE